MLQLNNKLNKLILNFSVDQLKKIGSTGGLIINNVRLIKNKAIDDKERLSKPRSQIKGVELLRNPGLYKVNLLSSKINYFELYNFLSTKKGHGI
jgi:hypothetical protein